MKNFALSLKKFEMITDLLVKHGYDLRASVFEKEGYEKELSELEKIFSTENYEKYKQQEEDKERRKNITILIDGEKIQCEGFDSDKYANMHEENPDKMVYIDKEGNKKIYRNVWVDEKYFDEENKEEN